MSFVVQGKGELLAKRADRIAIAPFAGSSPQVITLIYNGSDVKHTAWALLPDSGLYETELNSHPGGPEVAVASFSETRVVSMHRSGPNAALKFAAWKTGGGFELSDDALAPPDRDPEIVPFGGEPGILPFPPPGIRPISALAAATGGGGTLEPGRTSPPLHKPGLQPVPVGKIKVTLAPKSGHAVVAAITQDHRLRLSLWAFDDGGDYKVLAGKHAEADGGPASAASMAKVKEFWVEGPHVTGAEVVTASSGEGHALKIQRWRVSRGSQDAPASIQLISEHTAAEAITQVSAAPVLALNGTQVATAVKLEDGTLKIIGWKMESDGAITRWVDATGGAITNVSAAPVRGRYIVTALREADGRLKVSYWRFPSTFAGSLEHPGDAVEGPMGLHLACAHVPGEGTHLGDTVAATQSEDGKLKLFRYRVTD